MVTQPEIAADLVTPDAPVSKGRRERRKAETRQRLLAAARRLFIEDGYDGTRPQDIARSADVAAGTFYVHFADKRAAFLAFTDQAAEELEAAVGERTGSVTGLEDRLRVSLEALHGYAHGNPGVLRAAFADEGVLGDERQGGTSLRDRLAERLGQELRSGVLRGELSEDFDVPLIAHGMVGLIQHALAFGAHDDVDRDAVIDNVVRFCTRALARRESPEKRP
jgi:AcrR family transcriptional regulator